MDYRTIIDTVRRRWTLVATEEFLFLIGTTASSVILMTLLYAGVLPLSTEYFIFYSILLLLLALWRPNLAFLLFVAWLPLEIVTVTPIEWGIALRPYQWLAVLLGIALGLRFLSRRLTWPLFRWTRHDTALGILVAGGILTSLVSHGAGLKLVFVLISYYYLYLLSRVFLRERADIATAALFFVLPALLSAGWGLLQNVLFLQGGDSFAVMPGRPNGTMPEPDWLGLFLLVILALSLAFLARQLVEKARTLWSWAWLMGGMTFLFTVLILTVSRSAWLGAAAVIGIFTLVYFTLWEKKSFQFRESITFVNTLVVSFAAALILVTQIPLSRFVLTDRAVSTLSSEQTITIACRGTERPPQHINSVEELTQYQCEHILLEEREARQRAGQAVLTVSRPDPNVGIRKRIYMASIEELRLHPVFGMGWGVLGQVLGADERGAAYNASNLWLEVWLGGGILSLAGLFLFLAFGIIRCLVALREHPTVASVLIAWWAGWLIFSLFNSAIFLGFLWVSFAIIPLVDRREHQLSSTK